MARPVAAVARSASTADRPRSAPFPETVNLDDIKAVLAEIPDRDSPRFLARVAIGAHSPRVRGEGLHRHSLFGAMANCKFEVSRG